MQECVIDVQHLSFQIHKKQILKEISLQIQKGDIYALVGNNGAGKTTLIKILLGLELHYQGNIRLFGSEDLRKQRHRIGTVMSILSGNPSQKGKDYLLEMCMLCGADPSTEIPRVAALTECTDWLNKRLNSCSDGMYKRILIAGAMIQTPDILILDEPFNAVDPYGMERMRVLLYTLHRKGVTILVTSHILPELIKLATRFGVICEGGIQYEGTVQSLNQKGFFRYLYAVDNPADSIRFLEEHYPNLCVIPWYKDSISVIAGTRPVLPEQFVFLSEEEAGTDEVLRFYMNGKGEDE